MHKIKYKKVFFLILLAFSFCSVDSNAAIDETLDSSKNIIAICGAGHWTKGGRANGYYVSGINAFDESDYGFYGRLEYLPDFYKSGQFQSLNIAIGLAYTGLDLTWITPYATIGKCYSSYLTCYFNNRNESDEPASVDYASIYWGAGGYIPLSVLPYKGFGLPGVLDIALDYSFYGGYGSKSLYLGYGVTF